MTDGEFDLLKRITMQQLLQFDCYEESKIKVDIATRSVLGWRKIKKIEYLMDYFGADLLLCVMKSNKEHLVLTNKKTAMIINPEKQVEHIDNPMFKFICCAWFGKGIRSFSIYEDGSAIDNRGNAYLEKYSGDRVDTAISLLKNDKVVKKINDIIIRNKELLNKIPSELHEPYIMDGAYFELKIGDYKFSGWNIFSEKEYSDLDFVSVEKAQSDDKEIFYISKLQYVFDQIVECIDDSFKVTNFSIWKPNRN